MFPAHAGMKMNWEAFINCAVRVPRTRGDEPDQGRFPACQLCCVPRTRGDEPEGLAADADDLRCSPHTRG